MNGPTTRDLVIQVVIALALCVGGWLFLVKSKAEELRDVEARIVQSRIKTQSLSADHTNFEKIGVRTPRLRARARVIQARGSIAEDSSSLYGRITDLAEKHQVKIKNLRPGVERQMGDTDQVFVVTRIDMAIVGEFENIAEFLGSMNDIGAYLRPISVHIAPAKGEGGSFTVVQLGIETIRFVLPEPLVMFGGID